MHTEHYDYVTKQREQKSGYIKEVYDGKLYRKFFKSLSIAEKSNYVTAINTDRAPKFKPYKRLFG